MAWSMPRSLPSMSTVKLAQDEQLRIEVGGAWFTFGLNFTGWRAATVRYHGDMQGEIPEASDGFRILAPAAGSGTLWLAGIQPDGCIYEALPMPDAQVPFVADGRNEHLGPGAQRSHLSMMALQPPAAEASPATATIIERMEQRLLSKAAPSADEALAALARLFSESTSTIQSPDHSRQARGEPGKWQSSSWEVLRSNHEQSATQRARRWGWDSPALPGCRRTCQPISGRDAMLGCWMFRPHDPQQCADELYGHTSRPTHSRGPPASFSNNSPCRIAISGTRTVARAISP